MGTDEGKLGGENGGGAGAQKPDRAAQQKQQPAQQKTDYQRFLEYHMSIPTGTDIGNVKKIGDERHGVITQGMFKGHTRAELPELARKAWETGEFGNEGKSNLVRPPLTPDQIQKKRREYLRNRGLIGELPPGQNNKDNANGDGNGGGNAKPDPRGGDPVGGVGGAGAGAGAGAAVGGAGAGGGAAVAERARPAVHQPADELDPDAAERGGLKTALAENYGGSSRHHTGKGGRGMEQDRRGGNSTPLTPPYQEMA